MAAAARAIAAKRVEALRLRERAARQALDVASRRWRERLASFGSFATFGRVDTLVNNALDAGLDENLNVLDVPDATWERVMAINLFGPLRLTRAGGRQVRGS